MIILGISSGFHDAAVAVVKSGKVLYAGHAERYSKQKNDPFLNDELINAALEHGKPDIIVLHENSRAKKLRAIRSGDWGTAKELTQKQWIETFYPQLAGIPIKEYWHHETHASAGIMTSNFAESAIMVIDAIGEWDTATIWHYKNKQMKKLHSTTYPSSLGLFYTAVTHRVGLKPNEDEYILMGMAAYGDPIQARKLSRQMGKDFFKNEWAWSKPADTVKMKKNLQKGMNPAMYKEYDDFTIAMAAQMQIEERILAYAEHAKELTGSNNLVFMGGVALNCVANSRLKEVGFEQLHIMPNPGDAGSSLGAAALEYFNQTGRKIKWEGPYLGKNIPGSYPVNAALASLEKGELFGIANGKAEFGPRALGNRSLCADPRGNEIQDRMNEIKKRQEFRPFAPVILEEFAHEYFEMPVDASPYMQYVAPCKYPEQFPAIVHKDGTSRVQTVTQKQHPGLYMLLREFYKRTGCPMILNTSLNIKGQPIVNDVEDAALFAKQYGVPVHISD
jgi:carbamoyltransferase